MDILSPILKKALSPQEERLEVNKSKKALVIGILKEDFTSEKRVPLTPDAVQMLVNNGHQVLIESGAGLGANYSDFEYSEAGAEITIDKDKIFSCGLLIKIAPLSEDEICKTAPYSYIISSLKLNSYKKEYIKKIQEKKITHFVYDFFKDEHNEYPFLSPISQIAGTASILVASELMNNEHDGKGLLFGNITGIINTEVVILGANKVGEQAARVALGMGATVKLFDKSLHCLNQVKKALNTQITTSTFLDKALKKALMRCDVMIVSAHINLQNHMIVTEHMVNKMKNGAVIIDLAIDKGSCVETSELTTHQNPTIIKHGVIHYGVPNISSRYAKTASLSISSVLSTLLLDISEKGGMEEIIKVSQDFRSGLMLYKGILVSKTVGKWFNIPNKDINLLFL